MIVSIARDPATPGRPTPAGARRSLASPATQFYYVGMALPAVVAEPMAAAALALPVPLMTPILVMVLAVLELRRGRWARRPDVPRS